MSDDNVTDIAHEVVRLEVIQLQRRLVEAEGELKHLSKLIQNAFLTITALQAALPKGCLHPDQQRRHGWCNDTTCPTCFRADGRPRVQR